jgi:ABC-type branched-subunit amino acid transport system substrate-binding protein
VSTRTRTRSRLRVVSLLFAAAVLFALAATACGDDDDDDGGAGGGETQAAKTCSGEPIKIGAITTLSSDVFTNFPEYAAGVKAGAAALTKSCELGRPVEVIVCDDQFKPNTASQCAREQVAEGVVAVLYPGSAYGDQILAVTEPAGIPMLNNGSSAKETSSKLSFPVVNAVTVIGSGMAIAVAADAKKIALPGNELPVVDALAGLAVPFAEKAGAKVTRVSIPVNAVDMAPFAAQIESGGYDGVVPILDATKLTSLIKSLKQLGVDFTSLPLVDQLSNFGPKTVEGIGANNVEGILAGSIAVPPTDTDSPVIERYLADLELADESTDPADQGVFGTVGWASVQVVGAALAGQKKLTAATTADRLQAGAVTPAQFEEFGLPPIDFTKPAYPDDPILSKTRTFTNYVSVYRFDSEGVPVLATEDQWVDITKPIELTD